MHGRRQSLERTGIWWWTWQCSFKYDRKREREKVVHQTRHNLQHGHSFNAEIWCDNTSCVELESTAELSSLVWTVAISSSMLITVSTSSSSTTSGIITDTFLVHFFLPLLTADVTIWTNTIHSSMTYRSLPYLYMCRLQTHIIHVAKFLLITLWSTESTQSGPKFTEDLKTKLWQNLTTILRPIHKTS